MIVIVLYFVILVICHTTIHNKKIKEITTDKYFTFNK